MVSPQKTELLAYYWSNESREDFHTFPQRRRLEVIRSAVQRYTPPAPRVLDVGCGNGYCAGLALAGMPDVKFVGLEYSVAKLLECPEHVPGQVRGVIGDAEEMPIATASVDLALCCETMEHLPNPPQALAELRRVMKPDGRLVLTIPLSGTLHEPLVRLYHWLLRRPPAFAEHLHFFTIRRALRMVARARFTILENSCHGFECFGITPNTYDAYAQRDVRLGFLRLGLTGKPDRWMIGHTFLLVVARSA